MALLAAGLAACGGGSSGPPAAPPTRAPLPQPTPVGLELPPAGKIYFGAYVNSDRPPLTITGLETQIGRKLALDMHYYGWTAQFPLAAENSDLTYGRIPVESWNCAPTNAQINAGLADPLITTRALTVKAFSHPVFIRYLWDMNLPATDLNRSQCYDPATDNPDTTFSAAEYVAAWQHIRTIFTNLGVTNAIWVWSPSSAGSNPAAYYPGDSQVDWVGIDAYDNTNVGFSGTFAPIYALVAKYNKPILVAETGEAGINQTAFFSAAVPALQTSFSQVKGFMYYDARAVPTIWELTVESLPAFTAFANDPYMSAFGSL